jgi:hypothetical protein
MKKLILAVYKKLFRPLFIGALIFCVALGNAPIASAATLPTIRPSGDGTQTGITFSTGSTASVLIDDDPDTPTTSDYIQQTRNTAGDDTSYIQIDNMPSDFDTMTTLDIKADVSNSSGGNDTVTLKAQIFESEGGAALTNQVTLSTDTDASGLKTASFTLQGNNNKTAWDGAFILFTWTYGRSGPADTNFVRLTATELNGTYAQASAPSVATNDATSVTATGATIGGTITGSASTRGFATSTNATLSSSVSTTTETGSFSGSWTTAFSNTNLTGNSVYYFRAWAANGSGTGYGTIKSFLTLPDAPTGLIFGTVTATTTALSWTGPTGGATSYKLEICDQVPNCNLYTSISGVSTTTYSLTGNTAYDYAVRGTNATGDGAFTATSSKLTLTDIPGTPTFNAIQATTTGVSWDIPTGGAATYTLTQCSGGTCSVFTAIGSNATTTYSLTGNTSYTYAVQGVNGTGSGLSSATSTTLLTVPDLPGNPTYGSVTSSSMNVSWSTPTGGASTYKLERCITSTNTCTLTTSIGSSPQNVSGLASNTSYDFAVLATNATGDGYWSATTTQMTTASTPTVTTEAASSIGQTSATFNGTITDTGGENADVRGFAWGTASTLSGEDTATTTQNGSFPAESFTESGQTLVCNTTYYARAYAHNSGGYGYGSISASFTTSACGGGGGGSPEPRRAMRLFEGLRVKFISGRIIVNQVR